MISTCDEPTDRIAARSLIAAGATIADEKAESGTG
jgi:hypothetical protein